MGISPPGVVFYWLGTWLLVTPVARNEPDTGIDDLMGRYLSTPLPGPSPYFEDARRQISSAMCASGPLSVYAQQQRRWRLSMWREIGVRVLFNLTWPVIHFMRLRYMFKWHMSHSRRRNR